MPRGRRDSDVGCGTVNLARERRGDAERARGLLGTRAHGSRSDELRFEHERIEHARPPRALLADHREAAPLAPHRPRHLRTELRHNVISPDELRSNQVRARRVELVVRRSGTERREPLHHLGSALRP